MGATPFIALPGCSSQGNSIEEALDNIKEAISGVLKVRHKEEMPVPRETSEMLTEEIRQILAGRAEDGLPLTIETREVKRGTLRSLVRKAGLSVEEFVSLLRS